MLAHCEPKGHSIAYKTRSASLSRDGRTLRDDGEVHHGCRTGQCRMAQTTGGQEYRRRRLHLRPAARDELCGHA